MFTFLKVNGWHLMVPEPAAVITMQQVADSVLTEIELVESLQQNSRAIE
jgi:prophage maintenance system killer protein